VAQDVVEETTSEVVEPTTETPKHQKTLRKPSNISINIIKKATIR
jgi:hypothetical protein